MTTKKNEKNTEKENKQIRSPIVVVLGHIDHGKTTLLDRIRKDNVAEKESGGITQHICAYEAVVRSKDNKDEKITFIDTPGHEAFSKMRSRGADIADIAVLVIAADDGVKPQTLEALDAVKSAGLPFIVAVNKTDKPGADPDKIKKQLSEHEVYVEGGGGNVPVVLISAKSGEGVSDLLELVLLITELDRDKMLTDLSEAATGVVIESHRDPKRGNAATLLIRTGTIKSGDFVITGDDHAPVRIFEDFRGKSIKEAHASQPVIITGFNKVPQVGLKFVSVGSRKELEFIIGENSKKILTPSLVQSKDVVEEEKATVIPLVLKADTAGTLEALESEAKKFALDRIVVKILKKSTGPVGEDDVKVASSGEGCAVIGFRVKQEESVFNLAERFGVMVKHFDVIYDFVEWLKSYIEEKLPQEKEEVIVGRARILKIFSKRGTKQVSGGTVLVGIIKDKSKVRVLRRGNVLTSGRILELEQARIKSPEVSEGNEFGALIDTPIELAPKDEIEVIEEKTTKRML